MEQNATNATLLSLLPGMKRVTGNEHHGPCWKCGGRDRFFVKDGRGTCRQCQWSGDAIQLLRDRDGMSFKAAAEFVGRPVADNPLQKKRQHARPTIHASTPKEVSFDQTAWSGMAHKLMIRAMEMLVTHEDGKQAETYLRQRGLNLTALCGAFIGYIPTQFQQTWGGLKVTVERGISIPWFDQDQTVHKVNVRTDNPDMRYKMITGSTNGAYMIYRVRPNSIVVLVEGEIDALSIASATNWEINGVATGSTMGGRLLSVVAKLSLARRVLVAFDTDEPGETAARWWLDALPNAKRHLPTRHDVNEMLQEDGDEGVQEWIEAGMQERRYAVRPPLSIPLAPAKAVSLPGMPSVGSAYHEAGL